MTSKTKHIWIFRARFRRHAFGWRSQPAIKRIKEAVSEIKKVAHKDAALGGDNTVVAATPQHFAQQSLALPVIAVTMRRVKEVDVTIQRGEHCAFAVVAIDI